MSEEPGSSPSVAVNDDGFFDIEETAVHGRLRTPRPTKGQQVRTLMRNQFRIDANDRATTLFRLMFAPLYFLIFASTSLQQQVLQTSSPSSSLESSPVRVFPPQAIQWNTLNQENEPFPFQLVVSSHPSLPSSAVIGFVDELSSVLGWKPQTDETDEYTETIHDETDSGAINSAFTWGSNGIVPKKKNDDGNGNEEERRSSIARSGVGHRITVQDPSVVYDFRTRCNFLSTLPILVSNSTATETTPTRFLGCVYLASGSPDWSYFWMPPNGASLSRYLYRNGKNTRPQWFVRDNDNDRFSGTSQMWKDPNAQNVLAIQNAIQNTIIAMERMDNGNITEINEKNNTDDEFDDNDYDGTWESFDFLQEQPARVFQEEPTLPPWYDTMQAGLYANIGILFFASMGIQKLSEDVRIGLDRQFFLMGVPKFIYWLHYFLVHSIEGMATTAMVFAAISKIFVFPESRFGWIALGFCAAILATNSVIVLLPSIIKQTDALQVVPLVWMVVSIGLWIGLYSLSGDPSNIAFTLLSSLNPIWGIQQLMAVFVGYGTTGLGIGVNSLEDWWLSGAGPCFFAQIGNTFLLLGLLQQKHRSLFRSPDASRDKNAQPQQQTTTASNTTQPLPLGANVALSVVGLTKDFVSREGTDKDDKNKNIVRAVDGFDMTVLRGEIYGFLGHNGAGKSTVLSLLAGEISPTGGDAVFRFVDDDDDDTTNAIVQEWSIGEGHDDEIRSRLGFCPQHDVLFPNLSCREHLELFAELKGGIRRISEGQAEKEAIRSEVERRLKEIEFPEATDLDKPVGVLSGGMKRKVSLSLALLGDPSVLFLDEPTSGMDPQTRRGVWEMIRQAAKGGGSRGRSIILTTHFMDEADILSDRIGIINHGKMVATGTSLFLKQNLGTGYGLTYQVHVGTKGIQIRSSVESIIPGLELVSIVPATKDSADDEEYDVYRYHVPQGFESNFSRLLLELSNEGCKNINLELTTLEDVFLKLGGEECVSDGDGDERVGGTSSSDAQQVQDVRDSSDEPPLSSSEVSSQEMDDIWGALGEINKPGVARKIWIAAKINVLRKARSKQYWVFVVIIPIFYAIIGFGLGYLFQKQAETVVSPRPISLSATAMEIPSDNSLATVYGASPASTNDIDEEIIWETDVPASPKDFLSPPTGTYYLGGSLGNGTLMYNGSLPFSVSILSGLLSNHTLTEEFPGSSILGYLAPLDYKNTSPFVMSYVLVPTMISFGFCSATMLVVDLTLLKTLKMYALFRSLGISQIQLHAGVALQNILLNVLPFSTICVVLAYLLSSPLVGDGGRWLAFLLTLIGYAYAITPFSMLFEPCFKTYKAAKDWWFLISMLIQIMPYVIYALVFTPPLTPEKAAMDKIVSAILSTMPTFAFLKNLGFLQLTGIIENHDNVGVPWSFIWSWGAGVWFEIFMLFLMGTIFWAIGYWMVLRKEVSPPGSLSPDVDITDDIDLVEERNRAIEQGENGIRIVDAVKHYAPSKRKRYFAPGDNGSRGPVKEKLAVKGISIGVAQGELYCLLGPNGAGKTTLESCIMSELYMDGGTITLGNRTRLKDAFAAADVGYCPQNDTIFDGITVAKHIQFAAEARGLNVLKNPRHKAHVDAILQKLGLYAHIRKTGKSLSGGYKRKLCLAMALIGNPPVLIADEPSTGVDPVSRRNLWTILKPSNDEKTWAAANLNIPATLLSTHVMEEGEFLATRIGIQIDGKLVTTGTLSRLKEKFCQANFLEATFSRDAPEDAESKLLAFFSRQQPHEEYPTRCPLNPKLQESLMGRVKIQFPVQAEDSTTQLAILFEMIEEHKDALCIEFYHICSQSLEQIFIDLCKKQTEIARDSAMDEAVP